MLRSLMCRSYQRHCQNPSEDNTTLGWGWYDDSEGLNDDDAPGGDLPLCTTDADGTFGSTNPADYVETIVFQYQIQTTLEVTANELTNTQLPELERTLSNLLVPDLFQGSACQASRDRARRLLLLPVAVGNTKQRTTLEVPIGASDLTGLESTPLDTVASGLDGVRCRTELVQGADRCYVINGGFTLHGSSDIRWAQPIALELVKFYMDHGHVNATSIDSSDGVVAIQYLTEGAPSVFGDDDTAGSANNDNPAYTPPPSSTGGGESAREPPSNSNSQSDGATASAWPWVILGGGLILLGLAIWMCGRRRRYRKKAAFDGEDDHSLDSDEKPLDQYDYAYRPAEDAYLQEDTDVPSTSANSTSFVSTGSSAVSASPPSKSGIRNWSPSKWSTSTPPSSSYYQDDDDVEEDLYERSRRQRHFV